MTRTDSTTSVRLIRIDQKERHAFEELMDAYLGELSKYRETSMGATNATSYKFLPLYWSEKDRFPLFIQWEEKLVGFALVRRLPSDDAQLMQLAEFFVLSEHRRKGIGKAAASMLFQRFPGKWELQVYRRNIVAELFWKSCIPEYASRSFMVEEIDSDDRRKKRFRFSTSMTQEGISF